MGLYKNADGSYRLEGEVYIISDAHFKPSDASMLLSFLHGVPRGANILMLGDIFQLLIGAIPESLRQNARLLRALYRASLRHSILYLEGNHDFALGGSRYFSHIEVVPRRKQPLLVWYGYVASDFTHLHLASVLADILSETHLASSPSQAGIESEIDRESKQDKNALSKLDSTSKQGENILSETHSTSSASQADALSKLDSTPSKTQPLALSLAHGDIYVGKKYDAYISLMTSSVLLFILKVVDILTLGALYDRISAKFLQKNAKISAIIDYNKFARTRIERYKADAKDKADIIIEGHFHISYLLWGSPSYIAIPTYEMTKEARMPLRLASLIDGLQKDINEKDRNL